MQKCSFKIYNTVNILSSQLLSEYKNKIIYIFHDICAVKNNSSYPISQASINTNLHRYSFVMDPPKPSWFPKLLPLSRIKVFSLVNVGLAFLVLGEPGKPGFGETGDGDLRIERGLCRVMDWGLGAGLEEVGVGGRPSSGVTSAVVVLAVVLESVSSS